MITPPEVDARERELVEVTALTGAADRAFAKVPADTGLSDVADAAEEAQIEAEVEAVFSGARPAIAAGIAMLAVAVMVGGMFSGFQPRLFAAVGGLEGVYLAYRTQRARRFLLGQSMALAGTIGIAVLATLADPHGFQDLSHLPDIIGQAAAAGHVLRPPAPFDPGWRPMITFLCATEIGRAHV